MDRIQEKVYERQNPGLAISGHCGYGRELLVLQHDKPDDFVVATGETHSVQEFANEAFRQVDLDPNEFVKTDRLFMRPKDVDLLCGDYSKINNELGWQPKTAFRELVKIMVGADVKRWSDYLNGKLFPWDAPNYPGDVRLLKRHVEK